MEGYFTSPSGTLFRLGVADDGATIWTPVPVLAPVPPTPGCSVQVMMDSITRWMREPMDQTMVMEAISDSVTSIWETLVLIGLSSLLGGPVSATFATGSGLSDGSTPGNPFPSDMWYIQSLSVQTDSGEKFWNETQVGEFLWNIFAGSKATNTPYQPYVFDLMGSQFNIRPLTPAPINASYFYVRKPTPITDIAQPIPITEPGAVEFIRYNALALLKLGLDEFEAAASWESKASSKKAGIVLAANQRNTRKGCTVRPYMR